MNIKTLNNYIIIKRIIKKNNKKILLIEELKKDTVFGKVIFSNKKHNIKVGDNIIFNNNKAKCLEMLSKRYLFIKYKHIIGIIKE